MADASRKVCLGTDTRGDKGMEVAPQPRTACSALAPSRSPEAETLRAGVYRAGADFRTASVGPAIRDAYPNIGCIPAAPGEIVSPAAWQRPRLPRGFAPRVSPRAFGALAPVNPLSDL
ncbi:unnamed protein product, partial [Iphiclides podalirius]